MSQEITLFRPSEIKLTESTNGVNPEVQILRVGKFKHPQYGDFEITPLILAEMKFNFENNTRGIDIALDFFHESDKIAAGWLKQLELRENSTELWAISVDWTPRARKMLAEKELRYFSPDFAFQWSDPESGKIFSNVLFGGGLTNRPFVKGMEPIVSLGEYEIQGSSKIQKPNKGALKMDEKDQMIAELKKQIADLQSKLDGAGKDKEAILADNAKMQGALKCAEEEKAKAQKETEFTVLLSEGKACAAQKEAYMKGDMKDFIDKAQKINLAAGTGSGAGTTATGTGDVAADVLKLAEEKLKANASLKLGDAISAVLKENSELAKRYTDSFSE